MEQENDIHPDYIKGFNEGYLIRQERPELADSIAKSLENAQTERAMGFCAGSQQYEKEKEQVLSIPWMKPLPENYDEILPGRDMNKDDIDRDDMALERE